MSSQFLIKSTNRTKTCFCKFVSSCSDSYYALEHYWGSHTQLVLGKTSFVPNISLTSKSFDLEIGLKIKTIWLWTMMTFMLLAFNVYLRIVRLTEWRACFVLTICTFAAWLGHNRFCYWALLTWSVSKSIWHCSPGGTEKIIRKQC